MEHIKIRLLSFTFSAFSFSYLCICGVWCCSLAVPAVWLESNWNQQDFVLVTGPKHPLRECLVTKRCSISQHTPCLLDSEMCLSVILGNLHLQFL